MAEVGVVVVGAEWLVAACAGCVGCGVGDELVAEFAVGLAVSALCGGECVSCPVSHVLG